MTKTTTVVVETVIDGEALPSAGVVVKGIAAEGETVTVSLHDENGGPCLIVGKVVEVISEEDY